MSQEVILYDLPSKGRNACWSLNPWKIRMALNFMGVPYKTEWVEYPDIKPLFQSFSIPPNDPATNSMEYTIPAVRMPDGTYIMDSKPIILELEKQHPSPPLHLDNGYVERMGGVLGKIQPFLAPEAMPKVPKNLLNPRSADYFEETREKRFGMPLSDLAKSEKAGDAAWKAAEPGLKELADVLGEHDDGPFLGGKEVSYADFVLAGFMHFLKRIDEQLLFEKAIATDETGRIRQHYDACSKWLERDDH